MTFTTPCFVRVEDAAERCKLIEWLEGIGYIFNDCFIGARECAVSKYLKNFYVIAGDPHISRMCNALDAKPKYGNYIDAGTSVELFKVFAAMNDENDREQWFVVDDGFEEEMVCSKSEVDYDYILSCYDHRKATVDEIVEYFRNREK